MHIDPQEVILGKQNTYIPAKVVLVTQTLIVNPERYVCPTNTVYDSAKPILVLGNLPVHFNFVSAKRQFGINNGFEYAEYYSGSAK